MPPGRGCATISTGAVVLAVSLAAGTHLPFASLRQPVDVRNSLSPPLMSGSTPNPLDELPAWQQETQTVMFTATVNRTWLTAPPDWRLLSLDLYDGTGWSTDDRAASAGGVLNLPPAVSAALLGPEVHVTVHLLALAGPWVPTAGVPTAVSPPDQEFDAGSSVLVAPDPSTRSFDVSGRLSEPSRAALDAAAIRSGASVAALTTVPSCFPSSLRSLATRAAAGLARPDEQAVAVEQALARNGGFRLDTHATEGSSCARLAALSSARSGTPEQFATAFALMARSIGLPSRLAIGFSPGTIDAALGRTVVTGADASVWPEVDFAGLGWVAFDPVPSSLGGSSGLGVSSTATVPIAQQGLNQVRQTVESDQSRSPGPGARAGGPAAAQHHHAGSSVQWPLFLLLAVGVIAAGLVVGPSGGPPAPADPSPYRARSGPEDAGRRRSELLETVARFRVPVTSLTPSELSETVAHLAPAAGPPSEELAGLVDGAVYAGRADDALATQAWASSDAAVRALVRSVPPVRRVRGLVTGSWSPAGG